MRATTTSKTPTEGRDSPDLKVKGLSPAAFAALEERVQRLERLVLPPDPVVVLAQLAASTAGRVFSVRELRQHGKVDPALAAMLAPFRSSKALGVYLHALAAAPPPGAFVLERILRERGGWLWTVRARED